MYQQLFELFAGNETSFIQVTLSGDKDERGKRIADYLTIHKPLTSEICKEHVEGKKVIGLKPERGDVCKWGCIDIDPRNYENYKQKKYIDNITGANLPLVPVLSKSGGLHLFLFLKDWTNVKDVLKILNEWNNLYFLSKELFPCNKAVGLPYFNSELTTEFAIADTGVGLTLKGFLDLAEKRKISLSDFKNKTVSYEPEDQWSQYPPCVQKLIQEHWAGDNRNNYLFNVLVLETKKNENITVEELINIAIKRNQEIFLKPLMLKEVTNTAQSVKKGGYFYRCPPKHADLTPICNKELCKERKLGIGPETPEIIDEFTNISYVKDLKTVSYEFRYKDKEIEVFPEDMVTELAWRTKLLKHGIYWMKLPKVRKGPPLYDLLMKELVTRAISNVNFEFEETLADERYKTLKDFFEDKLEQDDFSKLKDGYVVLDSKKNILYFKRITMENWLKEKKSKVFSSSKEAMKLLNCVRHEYVSGQKNIWSVAMPEFMFDSLEIKKPKTKSVSEMDEQYHVGKFRNPETKKNT